MPNIFTDTTPVVDPSDPNSPTCVITDAWGLVYAQGGVVMAAALRAIETVLDRPDLTLASASATFCRPVACGPVTTEVEVLRSGRRGAQVHATLRDQHSTDGGANVVLTAVFTDPELEGPRLSPLERPVELSEPPGDVVESAVAADDRFELGFLDNTVWHLAATPAHADAPVVAGSPVPRLALWFRFTDPPAPLDVDWAPALLPIPGDSLGSALVVALGGGDTPVGSVSLQIGIQVLAPISGRWIGIDSLCTDVGNGLASGVVHLWSESGAHVATVTQTAMLRSFGG
ncbi:MAG TPA: thioesterase family protein [Microthrixaceae bacterium]|nr:thioesterase family protein [Microthrixaceae bacterium]